MEHKIVGIDPGKTGGICLLTVQYGKPYFEFFPLPLNAEGSLCFAAMKTRFAEPQFNEALFVVEHVAGFSGNGAAASFVFGYGTATLHCALIASGHQFTARAPRQWQALHFPKGEKNTDKNLSAKACAQWFDLSRVTLPRCRTPHTGLMDAALIALAYAIETKLLTQKLTR